MNQQLSAFLFSLILIWLIYFLFRSNLPRVPQSNLANLIAAHQSNLFHLIDYLTRAPLHN